MCRCGSVFASNSTEGRGGARPAGSRSCHVSVPPLTAAWMMAGIVMIAGCPPSDRGGEAWIGSPAQPPRADVRRTEPSPPRSGRSIIGLSVLGRPIEYEVHGDGDDVVLIMATIHGNEAAGTALVERMSGLFAERPELLHARRVVLVPVANPDGMARNIRHNVHGIDLNRNFPAPNFSVRDRHGRNPLSEPESRALFALIEQHRPNRIVSIHQPVTCIDYDGPAEQLAEAMAAYCDLPVKRLGSRPGSLGSYVGLVLEVPIITLELPREADDLSPEARWAHYGAALLAAVTFPDPVPDDLIEARVSASAGSEAPVASR